MFDGFTLDHIDAGEAILRVRHGGSGPPIKSGHHMAEENPAALADALAELLRR